jgi:hypothetical protein
MSTEEPEYEEYDPDEDESDVESTVTTVAAGSFGRTYQDLPDGYVTAGGFAKKLEELRGVQVRPQVIYATAKNTKTFPAKRHTDGRVIVPLAAGLEWWDAKEERVKSQGGRRSSEPTAWEKAQVALKAEQAPAQ